MKRSAPLLMTGLILFAGATLLSLSIGESFIGPSQWLKPLLTGERQSLSYKVIYELRLPRVLTSWLVGGALACAGAAFQAMFRNALAEPYVIGASSGAALGVALSIVFGIQAAWGGLGSSALMALIGALLVVAVVLLLGSAVGQSSSVSLLLIGIAISSLVNALVSALMILHDQRAVTVLSWVMGSLSNSHWSSIAITALLAVPSMILLWLLSRALDAFTLGDVSALSLGLDLVKFRIAVVAAASLATAAAVAAAGIIGFVGLVAPHVARGLVGQRHFYVIPVSIGVGATMMMLADALSRCLIAPAELPVGIVTAVVGSPFFLWILIKGRRSSLEARSSFEAKTN